MKLEGAAGPAVHEPKENPLMSLTSSSPARRALLLRSIPFWILLVGSLAAAAVGVWLILDKINTMIATLADGSATGVEVYAGQSWVVVGGALLAAGLFGLVVTLALAVARSFVPAPAVEVVESIDWTASAPDDASSTDDEIEAALDRGDSLVVAAEASDDAPVAEGSRDEETAAAPTR